MTNKRRWWLWVLLEFVGLLTLVAIGCGEDQQSDTTASSEQRATTTTEDGQKAVPAPETPARTMVQARQAVGDDDYATAVAITTSIGAEEADSIRRRIADRLAGRTRTALHAGDRGRARSLLIEANDYPMTARKRAARASYQAAKARALARRRAAANPKAERPAVPPATQSQGSGDSGSKDSADQYAGRTCDEIGRSFNVTPGSDPAHDRDNDGVACESQ